MRRRLICLVLLLSLLTLPLLSGCGVRRRERLLFAFDAPCALYAYGEEDASRFENIADEVSLLLERYHRLLDIYHEYDGLVNLATLNREAAGGPVVVGEELFAFLSYAKELYTLTDGQMNVALGAVLTLWHEARADGHLPDEAALQAAGEHVCIDDLLLDEATRTVAFADPLLRLDVGALGKGYAADRAAEHVRAQGVHSYALDLGGTLHVLGVKPDGRPFTAALRSPEMDGTFLGTVTLTEGACATSGSYERYMTVEGVRYHHIIDPDTLYPSVHFTSVSVLSESSALCDALSTALFCMPYEEAQALLERIDGVRAVLVTPDGQVLTYGVTLP